MDKMDDSENESAAGVAGIGTVQSASASAASSLAGTLRLAARRRKVLLILPSLPGFAVVVGG